MLMRNLDLFQWTDRSNCMQRARVWERDRAGDVDLEEIIDH